MLFLALLTPAVTWAGADEPPPDMAWPQVGAVGVHRNYYDHLYLPARPTELPETLQVVILNDHDPRRNRIAWFRPCCARRVANDDLYFPGVEGQLAHVWRVRLESCVSREGVYIYLSESIDPIAEDPKPLWDFYWYLGYDTEPTCPWLQ
jgi:hypothetical protein